MWRRWCWARTALSTAPSRDAGYRLQHDQPKRYPANGGGAEGEGHRHAGCAGQRRQRGGQRHAEHYGRRRRGAVRAGFAGVPGDGQDDYACRPQWRRADGQASEPGVARGRYARHERGADVRPNRRRGPAEDLRAISQGAAGSWMFTNRAPQIMRRDWRPASPSPCSRRTCGSVWAAADEMGVPLLCASLVFNLYRTLEAMGLQEEGNHADQGPRTPGRL